MRARTDRSKKGDGEGGGVADVLFAGGVGTWIDSVSAGASVSGRKNVGRC